MTFTDHTTYIASQSTNQQILKKLHISRANAAKDPPPKMMQNILLNNLYSTIVYMPSVL